MRQSGPVRLLLVTSNGAGMGHLTRLLSVALAAGDRATATMFSMSVALPVVVDQGIAGEYCPSVERGWMSGPRWHGYLRDRLVALVREIEADVVAFDGVAPYPGIGMARPRLPDVGFVWVRRGMWQPGVNGNQLTKSGIFDLIIEPGDLAGDADRGATASRHDAVRVPPVSLLEVVKPLPRHEAATALGLDPDRPTVLVTLGSGRLGDVAEPGRVVVSTLLEDAQWQIGVTRAAIAQQDVPIVDRNRIVELHGIYPLVRYLSAFDAVVSAAGYNAVHEVIPAGLPTLLVPNPATRTDDQITRADHLAGDGLALEAHPEGAAALAEGVRRLSDPAVRSALAARTAELPDDVRFGGAHAAADLLIGLGDHFEHSPPSPVEQVRRGTWWAKEMVKAVLGPRGTNAVKRILGRHPSEPLAGKVGHAGRLEVNLVTETAALSTDPATDAADVLPLLFAEKIPPDVMRDGPPVEHLLAGSSPDYQAARRRITETYFDVTSSPESTDG